MGISGHILGKKKLARFSRLTGLQFVRAYRRGRFGEGVVLTEAGHEHYVFDALTGTAEPIPGAMHWASCDHLSTRG